MDNDKFKPIFDYDNITNEQTALLEEIIDVLSQTGDEVTVEYLKHKFRVVEPPKYDYHTSPFVKCCNEVNIPVNVQGYLEDDGVGYPLIILSEDIRNLDKLYAAIKSS